MKTQGDIEKLQPFQARAIIEGLRVNFRPVFLTSFTTAIGFLSLNFSETPPFHDLGNLLKIFGSMFHLFLGYE